LMRSNAAGQSNLYFLTNDSTVGKSSPCICLKAARPVQSVF